MKALKNKMGKKGGFTLVEMLIVVAIIAILVAVSIPLINTSLESARSATDDANERAAKAEGAIVYLSGGTVVASDGSEKTVLAGTSGTFYYDIKLGKLLEEKPTSGYGKASGNTTKVIEVVISSTGVVTTDWN